MLYPDRPIDLVVELPKGWDLVDESFEPVVAADPPGYTSVRASVDWPAEHRRTAEQRVGKQRLQA